MAKNIAAGIQISDHCLRIVQMKTNEEGSSLMQALEFELPTSENDMFSNETAIKFQTFLKLNKVKISRAIIGITGKNINVQCIKVPSSCPDEHLQQLAQTEATQISEKSRTSLTYDYMVISPDENNNKIILSVLVRNSFVDKISDFFNKVKIKIDFFVPSSLALYYFFLKHSDISPEEKYAIIDIDKYSLNLAIVSINKLLFIRSLNVNAEKETSFDEEDDDYQLVEIDLSNDVEETINSPSPIKEKSIPDLIDASIKFASLQTDISNLEINRVILSGEKSNQRKLKDELLKKMGCPILEMNSQYLDSQNLPGLSGPFFQKYERNFYVAIGLAKIQVLHNECPIKIISERKKAINRLIREKLFEYAAMAVTFLLITISLLYTFTAKNYYENMYLNISKKYKNYQDKEQKIKNTLEKNKTLREQFHSLRKFAHSNLYLFKSIEFINSKIPESMHLSELQFLSDEKPRIRIKGLIEESFQDVYTTLDKFRAELKKFSLTQRLEDKDPRLNQEEGILSFEIEVFFK